MDKMKIKSSGFHLFLIEYLEKNHFDEKLTFEAVRSVANANWNSLPKDKRETYKRNAAQLGFDKIDILLEPYMQRFQLAEVNEKQKKAAVARKIGYFLEDSFELFDWDTQVFMIGHVNYQVKVKDKFFPIEVGLVKYSLDAGIISELHFHLNSSPLPIGHEHEARVRSEDTHQLPVNTSFGISYAEAKKELAKFIEDEKPFIFTLNEKDDILAVMDMFGKIIDTEVYVAPLESLLLNFHQVISMGNFSAEKAHDVLMNKNPWEYYDIGCEFHREKAASKFCSLAKVKRWAYHFSKLLLPPQILHPVKHSFNVIC